MSYKIQTTFILPKPPKGDKWWNPQKLSPNVIENGSRLLTEKEVVLLSEIDLSAVDIIVECRNFGAWEIVDSIIRKDNLTYRVEDTTPILSKSSLQDKYIREIKPYYSVYSVLPFAYNQDRVYGVKFEDGQCALLLIDLHVNILDSMVYFVDRHFQRLKTSSLSAITLNELITRIQKSVTSITLYEFYNLETAGKWLKSNI